MDRRRALLLAATSTLLVAGIRLGADLDGALGTDAPLWGLTARDLWVGAPPLVPPLYPGLLVPLVACGVSPVTAAGVLSALSLGLLIGASYRLARALGASTAVATVAALASLVLPDTMGWAVQVQPDALAAAWGVLLAWALVRLHVSPGRATTAAVVLLGGLAPLLREHGLVWAVVAMLGLATSPARGRLAALAVPVAMWLSPLMVGIWPGSHPLDVPWGDRAGGALSAFTTSDPSTLSFLHELHRTERATYAALVTTGDRASQLAWHVRRTLRLTPDGWLLVVAGLVAAGMQAARGARRSWLVAALPMVAALPALLIWSQRRHVVLVAPIALVLLVTVLAPARRLRVVVGLCWLLHGALNWPGYLSAWRTEVPRARHYAELGQWLHDHTAPGDLLGGVHQDVGLYAPALPRHDPDGSAADWRTFLITDRPPPHRAVGTWQQVFAGPSLGIWQLDPGRSPRPCAALPTPAEAPHLAVAIAAVDLGDCDEPPRP